MYLTLLAVLAAVGGVVVTGEVYILKSRFTTLELKVDMLNTSGFEAV